MSFDGDRIAKLELQVVALRIGLAELASMLVQRKVVTKREVVEHFQGLGDRVMLQFKGADGAEAFEQIANYVLNIPLPDD